MPAPPPKPNPEFQKAITLYEQNRVAEAVQAYRDILRKNPNETGAWINLGAILRQLGHFNASLACGKRALELLPDKPSILTNMGNVLLAMDRKEEALDAHARAVAAEPGSFLFQSNYAIALREFNEQEMSLKHFDIACAMQPDNDMIKWERALVYLNLARYKEGWEAFEIRWKQKQMKERQYGDIPRWRGEDLKGKTILIYEEQGFGDTILCSRYLSLVKARGARILFECKSALHRLFQDIGVDSIAEPGKTTAPFDYHIPFMSLPGLFGTTLENIPVPAKLHASPVAPPEAEHLLALGKDRLRVGIVWSGSVTFANNRKRAVNVSRFLPFTEIPGVQLYSLQKGPCEKELADAGGQAVILELGPHLNDFADSAAAIKKLDLVLMTDSSVAHLAGSLGVPVWNMLCYRPYWLYLSDREDCPWYSSMRLFRQTEPGAWDPVFKTVGEELKKAAALKKAGKWNPR